MRYKDTREIVSFIMTIVGNKDYLEQENFELWDNDYTKKDNNFSGLILYHELDGSFANGWRYTNGELTHKVMLDTDMDIDIGLKSYDCTTYNIYEITEQCTDWYVNGEYDGYSCTTSSTYIGTQTSCVWVDDGGSGSGGGGGGYLPNGGNNPYIPQSGDKFCKSGLSSTMDEQIVNTCVTAIMEYINNEFCGGNTNEGVYQTDYLQTYGKLVFQHGVGLTDTIVPFVSRHFKITGFMGFTNAIDHGNIVMTDIPSQIDNSVHNVAVIGYHPDGTLIYMDPEQGCLQEAPVADFSQNYMISITSCK